MFSILFCIRKAPHLILSWNFVVVLSFSKQMLEYFWKATTTSSTILPLLQCDHLRSSVNRKASQAERTLLVSGRRNCKCSAYCANVNSRQREPCAPTGALPMFDVIWLGFVCNLLDCGLVGLADSRSPSGRFGWDECRSLPLGRVYDLIQVLTYEQRR
jgi:hypothetical protein